MRVDSGQMEVYKVKYHTFVSTRDPNNKVSGVHSLDYKCMQIKKKKEKKRGIFFIHIDLA